MLIHELATLSNFLLERVQISLLPKLSITVIHTLWCVDMCTSPTLRGMSHTHINQKHTRVNEKEFYYTIVVYKVVV